MYNLTYPGRYSVYPGEYIPLPEKEALLAGLHESDDNVVRMPAVNMEELNDCFKIELLIPAVNREDIFAYVENNILSIVVLPNNYDAHNIDKLQMHEFDAECLQRHILLPGNADAEFSSAEFRNGILNIYISKTRKPSKTYTQRILIY
jgi:HSP20 family protein